MTEEQNKVAAASAKILFIKRSSIKGQITKFKNYLDKVSDQQKITAIEVTELSIRISKFEALSSKFDELQTEIEIINQSDLSAELAVREDIEQDIIISLATAKTILEKMLESQNETRRNSAPPSGGCPHNHHAHDLGIKLPQIQISKFDGSYFRWLEFRDTFTNLVHTNDKLTSIHKFHYLSSYLEGEASRIISNLEISSNNYAQAWQLLIERYDNKRLLINHHLTSLFNIQQSNKETEKSLRFLVDHVTKNLRALSSLGQPTEEWDTLVVFTLSSKLHPSTLLKWEEHKNTLEDYPSLETFKKFLIDRADVLEAMNRNRINTQNNNVNQNNNYNPNNNLNSKNNFKDWRSNHNNKNEKRSYSFATTSQERSSSFICIICSENHRIYDCSLFKSKSVQERLADVNKYRLCHNCLKQGHPAQTCRMGPCSLCKRRHNTLLHINNYENNSNKNISANHSKSEQSESIVNFAKPNLINKQVILSTARVNVCNPITGESIAVRALLDCGSQSSFVTNALKEKLNLQTNRTHTINIIGIGNNCTNKVNDSCIVSLKSLNSPYQVTLSCLVLEELTGEIPKYPINMQNINIPKELLLADPSFDQPAPIDVLIGADLFWDVLKGGRRSLDSPNMNPLLQDTQFGWLITGSIEVSSMPTLLCNHATTSKNTEELINTFLPKFWEMENVPEKPLLSENDKLCEKHFLTHTYREDSGRFNVRLPMSESPVSLGESYNKAKMRLLSLEKRFRRCAQLKEKYKEFIKEYADLGHLSESPIKVPNPAYFLCHHAVYRENSESTKLRVVFDGSNPSSSGRSLNDILMVGPNIQDTLFSILLRARQYKYLLCGDIEKMYRQINVNEQDRNMQLILWRDEESQPIKTLKLNTLTYGTASASFLSTRCLWQVGEECKDEEIKTIIQKDFLVDDLITGADSQDKLYYIKNALTESLNKACFKLRKFKSNLPAIIENIASENQDHLTISESLSTLGLGWNPNNDKLHFPFKISSSAIEKVTKRSIMSNAFKIFDPLGLLGPSIVQIKMLLQHLWQLKIEWDEQLPIECQNTWLDFYNNLHYLSNLEIPRNVLCDSPKGIEVHIFCDASQRAYGAAAYMRSIDQNCDVTVQLLCAKSKVASLKPVTIPRLELCAALLAARLSKSISGSIRCKPNRYVHWSDSSVVLSWLNGHPKNYKTFVANRVVEIGEITQPSSWRYVPTDLNPADLISRGVSPKQLKDQDLWWSGPSFLLKSESDWPTLKTPKNINIPEIKKVNETKTNKNLHINKQINKKYLPDNKSSLIPKNPEIKVNIIKTNNCKENNIQTIINFTTFSTLNKLQKTLAYVKRFIYNLKNTNNKRSGHINNEELSESFNYLCSISQQESFPVEFDILSKGLDLKPKSNILSLSPFFENNLIRVGGRINASNYSYNKKHPILLNSSHYLTKLLFEQEHLRNLHAGPQLLLAIVRDNVWPINGRRLARRTVNNCVTCRRVRGKTLVPKMGDLPHQRLNINFPFYSVGLDFAGPFQTLNRKGRGAKLIKSYMCLFVCLRYKCIHLEAVSELSMNAFIMTFQRFCSRRGKPAEVLCDNGRNFVATDRALKQYLSNQQRAINEFAVQEGVKFTFLPAYAPHFGGIWEAGVKSAKHHIKRVMGNSHLTFEELSTLFAKTEAILNSRPLYPLSSSPTDFLPLSPGHFLIGRPLVSLPTPSLEDRNPNALKRHERLEQIRQHFWQRWQKEFISELQQRTKWRTTAKQGNLKIGDLVLLKEDFVPPMCWRLGRVIRLFPGRDGISRVADIRTTKGTLRRPLVRLCPLFPFEEDEN